MCVSGVAGNNFQSAAVSSSSSSSLFTHIAAVCPGHGWRVLAPARAHAIQNDQRDFFFIIVILFVVLLLVASGCGCGENKHR